MPTTIHQRYLLSQFQEEKNISLERLRSLFVETNIMNMTTLYRILDRWKESHTVHELEIDKKRIFVYCDHSHENSGVKISYCKNCDEINETHFSLPENVEHSERIEFLKHCEKCS